MVVIIPERTHPVVSGLVTTRRPVAHVTIDGKAPVNYDRPAQVPLGES
jgi:hypothetical protein